MSVCTRFAPSPTGSLHIGGARTAFYCWLYARKHSGTFRLRIEDTDRERSTQASVDSILESLHWLGLHYNDKLVYQTERFGRYREVMEQWLSEGKAYRCDCSKERLAALREDQSARKEKPRYDGYCRSRHDVSAKTPHVVRFANPVDGEVLVSDLIKGPVSFVNSELDDLIIWRSDDTPTYNFTVVIDDWDMKITHVIRGDDHLTNTPRQINMLHALGVTAPHYAHVSMILGADGKRLSKRHGAVGVLQYRDEGFLPHALLNYLVRLGWSHGDQEIFSQAELIQFFDITALHKAPATFNPEKLLWLNQHYIKTDPITSLIPELQWHFDQLGIDTQAGPALADLILVQRERAKTLREMALNSRFFFEEIKDYDLKARQKHLTAESIPILEALISALSAVEIWAAEPLHTIVKETAEQLEIGLAQVAQPIRVALTGNTISPPIDSTLALMGRERSVARLQQAQRVCR
ncbi:MAG: glutamyl-tRNA synthetase [Gammaproteobacteria bacterium]|nr:glutamyl-tRNA synthetase [Gammaproteobacteria bacterium]